MESVRGPSIAASQSLKYHEWLVESYRPLHCPLEAEIPVSSAIGDHPVEDVVALRVFPCLIAPLDSETRYGRHSQTFQDRSLSGAPPSHTAILDPLCKICGNFEASLES